MNGWNILLDEIAIPPALWSSAPRQVSIALTNACDLTCSHCYAPKSRDHLPYDAVTAWMAELDANDCFGVCFGGGEPTLHPRFAELCRYAAQKSRLAVSFTTHGHSMSDRLAEVIRGSVHFIRVSMDGVEATYESIRRRSFSALRKQLALIRSVARFGINVVVNDNTLPDLDAAAASAEDAGASEILLLPQISTGGCDGLDERARRALRAWVDRYNGKLALAISEDSSEGFPVCDPLRREPSLRAYAHIDATGVLKASSFVSSGAKIGDEGVMHALDRLAGRTREDTT